MQLPHRLNSGGGMSPPPGGGDNRRPCMRHIASRRISARFPLRLCMSTSRFDHGAHDFNLTCLAREGGFGLQLDGDHAGQE